MSVRKLVTCFVWGTIFALTPICVKSDISAFDAFLLFLVGVSIRLTLFAKSSPPKQV